MEIDERRKKWQELVITEDRIKYLLDGKDKLFEVFDTFLDVSNDEILLERLTGILDEIKVSLILSKEFNKRCPNCEFYLGSYNCHELFKPHGPCKKFSPLWNKVELKFNIINDEENISKD
jgi:hypothetical protein